MNIVSCLVLASLGLAPSRAECPGDETVEWGSYGYFQTCRSHHIRQALQVKCNAQSISNTSIHLRRVRI